MKTLGKHHAFHPGGLHRGEGPSRSRRPVMPVVFSTFKARAKVMAETEAAEGGRFRSGAGGGSLVGRTSTPRSSPPDYSGAGAPDGT